MLDPILVWGAGPTGLLLSAALTQAGEPAVLVDPRLDVRTALKTDGLTVEQPDSSYDVSLTVASPDEIAGYSWRRVFYCGESDRIEPALQHLVPLMPSDGYFVTTAEGLTERTASRMVGGQRALGCLLLTEASCPRPGLVRDAGYRRVILGELDGRFTDRAEEIYALLKHLSPDALISNNLWGFRWSRLVYHSLHLAAAATGFSLAESLNEPQGVPFLTQSARLVARIAALTNIDLEAIDGFDPAAFDPREPESLGAQAVAALHPRLQRSLQLPMRLSHFEALFMPVIEAGRLARADVSPLEKMLDRLRGAQAVEQSVSG